MSIFPSGHDGGLLAGIFTRVRARGGQGWRTMPRTGSVRSDMAPSQMPALPVPLEQGSRLPFFPECQWEGGPTYSERGVELSKREPGPQVA